MITRSNGARRHTAALTAIVLGTTLSLTGCFGNPLENLVNQGIEGGVQNMVEDATGGLFGTSTGQLPKDFPSEIPVVPGNIQGGFGMNLEDGHTWTAVVEVQGGNVEEVGAHIRDQMVSAGFEATELEATLGTSTMATFSKDNLTVLVTVTSDDSGAVAATYIVGLEK